MENTDEISKDFILCLERLLSAIINLHKYLPNEEKITNNYEESKKKLQVSKIILTATQKKERRKKDVSNSIFFSFFSFSI